MLHYSQPRRLVDPFSGKRGAPPGGDTGRRGRTSGEQGMKEFRELKVLWCDCGEPIIQGRKKSGWVERFSRYGMRVHECPRCHVLFRNLSDTPPAHVCSRLVCRFCFSEYENGRRIRGSGCLVCNASPEKVLIPYPDLPRIVLRNFERLEIA